MEIKPEEGLATIKAIIDKWTNKYSKKTVHLFDKVGGPSTFHIPFNIHSLQIPYRVQQTHTEKAYTRRIM